MKAIFTKYHGPGNVKGSRISASDGDNRVIISRDCALSIDENHDQAAVALCRRMGWTGMLAVGDYKRGRVYVWIPANRKLDLIEVTK